MNQGEIPVTLVGNLTAAPELRFTGSGKAVANFTVAVNHRRFVNNEWTDAGTSFFRCTAWQNVAENIVESFPEKGMPILVYGTQSIEQWTGDDGIKRDQVTVTVMAAGPNLAFSVAEVSRPKSWGQRRRTDDEADELFGNKEETADNASENASEESPDSATDAVETTPEKPTQTRARSTRKRTAAKPK